MFGFIPLIHSVTFNKKSETQMTFFCKVNKKEKNYIRLIAAFTLSDLGIFCHLSKSSKALSDWMGTIRGQPFWPLQGDSIGFKS